MLMWAVTLFLVNYEKKMQNKHGSVIVTTMAMLQAASSVGIRIQAERETPLAASYNDLDATLTGHINDTSALFWIWYSGV